MRNKCSLLLKIVLYILAVCAYLLVDAQTLISSTTECNDCMAVGGTVCKLRSAENLGYCCD